MSLYQTDYRWRNDDGSETTATWAELVNTSTDVDVTSGNVQLRIRLAIEEQDGGEYEIGDVLNQFAINAGGYTTLGASTTGCIYFNSSNLTHGDDTTQQITAFTYVSTNEGVIETVGGIGAFSNDGAEYEYTVEFVSADLSDGDTVYFRLPDADGGYTNTGTATITKTGGGGGRIMSSIAGAGGLAGAGGIAGQGGGLAG